MNVLIVTPFFYPNVGGVETRLLDICRELDRLGHRVDVMTYMPLIGRTFKGKPPRCEVMGTNIHIKRIRWIGGNLFHKLEKWPVLEVFYICPLLWFHTALFLVKNMFKKQKTDACHTLGLNAALVGRFLRAFYRGRWVISTHHIYEFDKKSLTARVVKAVFNKADEILALSKPSLDELKTIGVTRPRMTIHTTWVDQNRFKPLEDSERMRARRDLGIGEKTKAVFFVGRLMKKKGIFVFLEAARLAAKGVAGDPYEFFIIGSGFEKKRVESESSCLKNVRFIGEIENSRLPAYYSAADIFVMPSVFPEGFGRVAIEALSCGTPVIFSDRGGLKYTLLKHPSEVVAENGADHGKDHLSGLPYFKPVSPEPEAILKALTDMEGHNFQDLRASARHYAEKKFSARNIYEILDAYRGVISYGKVHETF